MIVVCLAGARLLPADCADDKPKMEVPDTDTAVFTQMEQTDLGECGGAEMEAVRDMPLVRQEVGLASGGTAVLYALDTGEEPAAGTDGLTSVSTELVLNSAAVQLGEYGTVRDLAESELYHWANASEFSMIQYTQPMQISDTRYAVHLRLENDRIGMEQMVVYTDLSGVARVDRLWRSITDVQADEGSPAFDETADYLISDQTL